jgi:hypothetical protein
VTHSKGFAQQIDCLLLVGAQRPRLDAGRREKMCVRGPALPVSREETRIMRSSTLCVYGRRSLALQVESFAKRFIGNEPTPAEFYGAQRVIAEAIIDCRPGCAGCFSRAVDAVHLNGTRLGIIVHVGYPIQVRIGLFMED